MSSDDDEDVKLYNSLERNRKRQHIVVSLSSSESEGDDDDDFEIDDVRSGSSASPFRKRLRSSGGDGASASPGRPSAARTVLLDDEDEEKAEYADDLLTPTERARERERERRLEMEIQAKIAADAVLNQTLAVMSNARMVRQPSTNGTISLDSDDDDDEVKIVPTPRQANGSLSAAMAPTAVSAASAQPKGDRITLQVRSNGDKTDDIVMFSHETFSVLYERFCSLHGLPRSAVQMSLDGESLRVADTPHNNDLASGDLIDAKVDFSKADTEKKKRHVRLVLVVEGRKPEKFKIDATSTLDKLHGSFCKRHSIADPDDVEMTVRGELLRLRETVEDHGLYDDDVINVAIRNFVDPASIELNVRYDAHTTETHRVIPTQQVQSLITQVATHLSVTASLVTLRLDGEGMQPNQTFQYYDLEGGELIEVKVRS